MTRLIRLTATTEATTAIGILIEREYKVPTPVKVVMYCCGGIFEFPTDKSFPKENMPCPCGAEGRWVVFYKEA